MLKGAKPWWAVGMREVEPQGVVNMPNGSERGWPVGCVKDLNRCKWYSPC